jgi:nucleoside-diphosphate-sugar epimerase
MPKTVLITGLNGFIAVHTALHFLQHGWHVRGTVRSLAKMEVTLALPVFESYVKQGRLTGVVVESLQEGDFSSALEDVDAVRLLMFRVRTFSL